MKKTCILILSILLISLIAGMPIIANAATNGNYTYTISGSSATITDVAPTISGAVSIPSSLGGVAVTAIGENAFRNCTKITSITIPARVKSIGSGAFYNCSGLTSVTILGSIESIGTSAFYGCEKISSVSVATLAAWSGISFENLYSNPMAYGASIKVGSSAPTSITVPSNITKISDYAFYGWKTVTSITISDGAAIIGKYAFANCSAATSVQIPITVNTIDAHAFLGCNKISKVYFATLGALVGLNFETLYSNPMAYGVDTVYIAGSGTTTITVPNVSSINKNTFAGWRSLTAVTFPAKVTSVGCNAFYGCENLASVTAADITVWPQIEFENEMANPLYYADTLLDGNGNDVVRVLISSDTEKIGNNAFYGYEKLQSVIIPSSVTEIGTNAFYGCSALSEIEFPATITAIGSDAFWGCENIQAVTLPSLDTLSNVTMGSLHSNPLYYSGGTYIYKPVSSEALISSSINAGTIAIDGKDTVPNDETITETVFFNISENGATSANIVVKIPSNFSVVGVKGVDFEYVDIMETSTSGSFKYVTVWCDYTEDYDVIPQNKTLAAFDIELSINSYSSTTAYTFSIDELSFYGSEFGTYTFTNYISHALRVISTKATNINIIGPSTVYDSAKFTAECLPSNTVSRAVKWSVSNTSLASISTDGVVTALSKTGTVTITAATTDGSNLTATKTVNLSTTKRATLSSLTTSVGMWLTPFNPTVTNYVVYIPEDNASVKFSPTYTGGTLKINGNTVASGGSRTVSTTNSSTTVLLKRSGVSDARDMTYTVNFIKTGPTTKTTISEDGKTFTIKPIFLSSGNQVVVALYKGGKLVEIKRRTYSGDGNNITIEVDSSYTSAKVMVYDKFDSVAPLSAAESL